MVALDRIRLTGLLKEKPLTCRGFSYFLRAAAQDRAQRLHHLGVPTRRPRPTGRSAHGSARDADVARVDSEARAVDLSGGLDRLECHHPGVTAVRLGAC